MRNLLKACIGKKGAYFWDTITNRTYFVFDEKDRSEEWSNLYKQNKIQASYEYQRYALQFAYWYWKQKSKREANKDSDQYCAGHGSYYPGKYHVGNMFPETVQEWRTNAQTSNLKQT